MKIKVDRAICAGHALCAARAPDVYTLDDEGFCISDGISVPAAFHEQAWIGAAHCPEHAITVIDEE